MTEPDISNMRRGFLYSEEYSPERKGEDVIKLCIFKCIILISV